MLNLTGERVTQHEITSIAGASNRAKCSKEASTQLNFTQIAFSRFWSLTLFFGFLINKNIFSLLLVELDNLDLLPLLIDVLTI